jgi:hypothetical protein
MKAGLFIIVANLYFKLQNMNMVMGFGTWNVTSFYREGSVAKQTNSMV